MSARARSTIKLPTRELREELGITRELTPVAKIPASAQDR